MNKYCPACKKYRPVSAFSKMNGSLDGLKNSCKKHSKASNTPDHASVNLLTTAKHIFNGSFSKVPKCYRSMIHEQKQLNAELNKL